FVSIWKTVTRYFVVQPNHSEYGSACSAFAATIAHRRRSRYGAIVEAPRPGSDFRPIVRQSGIQARPSAPVTRNAARHPQRGRIQAANSGAIIEPKLTAA